MTGTPSLDHDRVLDVTEAAKTLRRFYDSASVLMGTVELRDDDIIHLSDNNASATFFGTTPEAMRGRSARELDVPEPYIRMWFDAYRKSLTSVGPVRFDYEHEGKGWLSVTVNHVGPGEGRERFLYAGQRERSRISQLLHDELQQQLFALQLMLNSMLKSPTPAKADELAAALELTTTSMVTTRTLISELSSVALHEGDLSGALVWLTEHMKGRYGLEVSLHFGEGLPQIPDGLKVLLFQCVQEFLFNVVNHAQAQSVVVTVQYAHNLQLEVRDETVSGSKRALRPDRRRVKDSALSVSSIASRRSAVR